VFPKDESLTFPLLGLLNSRLISYILRVTSQSLVFHAGYVSNLPISNPIPSSLGTIASSSLQKKKLITAFVIDERDFKPNNFFCNINENLITSYLETENIHHLVNCVLHAEESIIESIVFKSYKVPQKDIESVIDETGTPAGWHPLIAGYDTIPEIDICEIPKEVIEYLNNHKRINPSEDELARIKSRLRALYEAGPGAKVEDVIKEEETETNNDEDEAEVLIGKRIPIPTETFLEELSVKMEIHPISIYWLLKEMQEKEGIVCWPEARRYVEDYFTVMILRLLGFRWPKQVEAGEPVPEWADKDGIIPITEHTGERTLLERIRDRIGAEFGEDRIASIETEFSDILFNAACKEAEIKGKKPPRKRTTLAEWLKMQFFKRHTSQFKKRPITWHISSSKGTFQVLLFYHKLTSDTLKNLKNRYLAKVRQFYGVLLKKARVEQVSSLSKTKLEDIMDELEDFTSRLDRVINLPYEPLIDDGVRVNIAPLQKMGLLKYPVLSAKDVDRAIADRNRWREDDKEQDTIWRI